MINPKFLSKKFFFWYMRYGMVNLIVLVPGYIVNLAVVTAFALIEFHLLWILSSVIIGDIVAWFINQNISLYLQIHWKLLHRLQDEAKEFLRDG